ncbi:MAG: hypothetical protein M1813_009253 [Trichoglossum hirsutum]|nr:MAG: hypothetical protein M1813_009253 [Trichoglossum hirsutum]
MAEKDCPPPYTPTIANDANTGSFSVGATRTGDPTTRVVLPELAVAQSRRLSAEDQRRIGDDQRGSDSGQRRSHDDQRRSRDGQRRSHGVPQSPDSWTRIRERRPWYLAWSQPPDTLPFTDRPLPDPPSAPPPSAPSPSPGPLSDSHRIRDLERALDAAQRKILFLERKLAKAKISICRLSGVEDENEGNIGEEPWMTGADSGDPGALRRRR